MLRAGSMLVGLSDDDKEFYNAEKVLTKVASRGNGYDESMNHDEVPHNPMHVPQQQRREKAKKDKQRWTPSHAMIREDMIDDTKKKEAIVKMLLKYGVDPEAKDGEGKVPLQRMPLWR